MNQQQQEFHNRVAELLKRTERLHRAVKQFAETVDVEQDDDALVTVGAGAATGAVESDVIVSTPVHGDALAPDYAFGQMDDAVDEYDDQPPRERVEKAFDKVQAAADDVNALVDDINIDELLNGIDLDDSLQM